MTWNLGGGESWGVNHGYTTPPDPCTKKSKGTLSAELD